MVDAHHASRVFDITGGSAGFSANWGGGIENFGTATVTDCTFTGNSASGSGSVGNDGGTLTLKSSLMSGSTGGDLYNAATITSGGSNLLADASPSNFSTTAAHDQFGVANAHLGALAVNGGPTPTCVLMAGSSAIDADYSNGPTVDRRSLSRPQVSAATPAPMRPQSSARLPLLLLRPRWQRG